VCSSRCEVSQQSMKMGANSQSEALKEGRLYRDYGKEATERTMSCTERRLQVAA
jgi:hypothetical protein